MHSSDLVFDVADTADSDVFHRFYDGYKKAFVLPEEMENEEGFSACLDLNHGAEGRRLAGLYGPFREICVVARDRDNGAAVGGANLIAMPWVELGSEPLVLANLNYIYLEEDQRGKAYFRPLVAGIYALVAGLFGRADSKALIFIEQNDPIALDDAAYARDTHFTGMDQFDRLRIWAKVGALYVDIPYIQPSLSSDHPPVDTLILSVLGADGRSSLPVRLMRYHLERFFAISVLKGAPINSNETAQNLIDWLHAMERQGKDVPLVDIRALLASLGSSDTVRALADKNARFRGLLSHSGVA